MKTLRRFLHLIAPYWFNRRNTTAWLLLTADTACTLILILIGVWIVQWDKRFYDALHDMNGSILPALVIEYLGYLGLVVAWMNAGEWLRKRLIIHWREQMSEQFHQAWLADHKHYRLQLTGEPDNPDQRIAEDIALLASQSLELVRSFISKSITLITYLGILYGLSGVQTFTLAGHEITIHGYLIWIALAYSLLTTWLGHLVGGKLQALNVERQHREADYRATLLRIRDHSEQIALYRGAPAEQARLEQRFAHIKTNWRALIDREYWFGMFYASYVRISIFIPIFATLPLSLHFQRLTVVADDRQTRALPRFNAAVEQVSGDIGAHAGAQFVRLLFGALSQAAMKDDRRDKLPCLQSGNVHALRAGDAFARVFVGAADIDQRCATCEQFLRLGSGDVFHAILLLWTKNGFQRAD